MVGSYILFDIDLQIQIQHELQEVNKYIYFDSHFITFLKIVGQNEKHFSVTLSESKKMGPISKKTLLEAFKLIKIDISNSYLDYLMNKMITETKSIRDIEPKHFFIVLKKIEEENAIKPNEDEDFEENQINLYEKEFFSYNFLKILL